MEFFFAIFLIVILLIIPALIRRARRPPTYSQFGDHEIKNPYRDKTARCIRCRRTFEWKGSKWKEYTVSPANRKK